LRIKAVILLAKSEVTIHEAVPLSGTLRGFKVREDVLFMDAKGKSKPKLRAKAETFLERLEEPLQRLLGPDETIFYVANAQWMPAAGEQLILGWHVYTLPRVVLMFTSQRILCFRIRTVFPRSWKWDRGIHSVRWGDLESVSAKGVLSRVLRLKMRNGEKASYWRITQGDSKKIHRLAEKLMPHASGELSASGTRESLCPDCLGKLVAQQYECSGCRLPFKTERELFWRGLLIPGAASFYIGLTGLGVLRFLVECLILFGILSLVWDGTHPGRTVSGEGKPLVTAMILLVVLLLEKLFAIAISRRQIRDFLPAR
jgi:TM2 domain-containing membrane protein YozV